MTCIKSSNLSMMRNLRSRSVSVLTAFMLGLALGSALAGRLLEGRAMTARKCLLVYGALELVIGLYGLGFIAVALLVLFGAVGRFGRR